MAKKFKVGDKVICGTNEWGDKYDGAQGKIILNDGSNVIPWLVRFEDGDELFLDAEDLKAVKTKKASKPKQTYLGNGKHDWEHVVAGTYRLRVPGGWLYESATATSVFVPLVEVTGHVI